MHCENKSGALPVRVVNLTPFRVVTSGLDDAERVMDAFNTWQEAHMHLIRPMLYGAPDFLSGEGERLEWLWAVKEGVTDADVTPYRLTEHPGGLYACAVTVDGDDERMGKTYAEVLQWIGTTGFEPDESPARRTLCHMLEPDQAIRAALGYDQLEMLVPIRIRGEKDA